jgi:hypothetical protein
MGTPGNLPRCQRERGNLVPSDGPASDFGRYLSMPNAAQIYDYLLGGCSNYQPDRQEAEALLGICPGLRDMARSNREFLDRAVTWAARQGILQFADLGSGYPVVAEFRAAEKFSTRRPDADIHVSARAVNPDARVAYADHDIRVTDHADALLAHCGVHDVAVVRADLRDPGTVLADPGLRKVIDPGQPCCVILGLVLHYMTARRAREIVAGYAGLIAPGSYLVITPGVTRTLRCGSRSATPTRRPGRATTRGQPWSRSSPAWNSSPGDRRGAVLARRLA